MRVLVTGGRHWDDPECGLRRTLDTLRLHSALTVVIQGGATGADSVAKEWCRQYDVPCITEEVTPQEWDMLGGLAGHARNLRMLRLHRPDICIAAPGHDGTKNMMAQAKAFGIPVLKVIT